MTPHKHNQLVGRQIINGNKPPSLLSVISFENLHIRDKGIKLPLHRPGSLESDLACNLTWPAGLNQIFSSAWRHAPVTVSAVCVDSMHNNLVAMNRNGIEFQKNQIWKSSAQKCFLYSQHETRRVLKADGKHNLAWQVLQQPRPLRCTCTSQHFFFYLIYRGRCWPSSPHFLPNLVKRLHHINVRSCCSSHKQTSF